MAYQVDQQVVVNVLDRYIGRIHHIVDANRGLYAVTPPTEWCVRNKAAVLQNVYAKDLMPVRPALVFRGETLIFVTPCGPKCKAEQVKPDGSEHTVCPCPNGPHCEDGKHCFESQIDGGLGCASCDAYLVHNTKADTDDVYCMATCRPIPAPESAP
jgi:hypothetical protein